MPTPTWKTIREHPLYSEIKGRSKITDKQEILDRLARLSAQMTENKRRRGTLRTTILPEASMESQNLLPFLGTRQMGRYGTLSHDADRLTSLSLRSMKRDRLLLSLYDWYSNPTSTFLRQDEKRFIFLGSDGSIFFFFLDHCQSTCPISYEHVKKNGELSNMIRIQPVKSKDTIYQIVKTFDVLYERFNGRFHSSSDSLPIVRRPLSADDQLHLRGIHNSSSLIVFEP